MVSIRYHDIQTTTKYRLAESSDGRLFHAFGMKDFLLITGASRGFGRELSNAMPKELDVVAVTLVARTPIDNGLIDEVKSQVNQVYTIQADLSDLSSLDASIDQILETIGLQSFDRLIFVNNAANLGHIGPVVGIPSLANLQQAIDFNLTSALWMATRIAQQQTDTLIINISSLVAIQPFPSLAVYSCIKAARDSFTATMAKEGIRTLNYAPGPLETDMAGELRAAPNLDASIQPHYAKQLIDPIDSAAVLARLVKQARFKNGEHIDYYDVVDSC